MQEEEAFVTVRLTWGTSTTELATACRTGWRSFAALSVKCGWGRGEVAAWAARSYDPIVRATARPSAGVVVDDELAQTDPRFVQRIVRTARSKLVETLWSFNDPDARVQFARDSYRTGLVVRCQDSSTRLGFSPRAGHRTLASRVLSLVAADLLTRSIDFSNGALCDDCGQVMLDKTPCCFRAELRKTAT